MTPNPTTTTTQRYTSILITKLQSFFKLPKGKLREESDEIGLPNVVSGRCLNDVGCRTSFYCTHVDKLVLDNFFVYKKFIKSNIYAEYLNGLGLCEQLGGYALYMHFNNIDWLVYEADAYEGIGGMFVKESAQAKTGFVIEPLKHFLANNYQGEDLD